MEDRLRRLMMVVLVLGMVVVVVFGSKICEERPVTCESKHAVVVVKIAERIPSSNTIPPALRSDLMQHLDQSAP
ncbi:hypothetical protein HYC85_003754 [Camellia sinensis]|uniref:Uncharacterized protein n=1 Tax=Camellia sinensis TaxID=4442 RepID=A0A7J7HV58_CAMSI|nr:hypothetical protein HYC85_003754 [Camellia sinensis]